MDLITRKELYNYLKNETGKINAEIAISELSCLYFSKENFNFLEFEDFEFIDAKFNESSFQTCRFNNCIFNNTSVIQNSFFNCTFNNCIFEDLSFFESLFKNCVFENSKSKNIKFNNSEFNSTEFYDTILEINDLKYLSIYQSYFDINSQIIFNCRLDNNLKMIGNIFNKQQTWPI